MTELSVNLNKIALLRNTRDIGIPGVIKAARTVIEAGAYGITVHPRPDQRHIRYSDVYELAGMLTVEFNIEGNPFTGRFQEVICEVKPTQVTLVPDEPGAVTSNHGWDLNADAERLKPVIETFKKLGIRVSLFMDTDLDGIQLASKTGADRVELYTEPYAKAFSARTGVDEILGHYTEASIAAQKLGMAVNAGHDLNLDNLGRFCSSVPGVSEVSIGHALIADALEMGLYMAVKEYLKILAEV